MAISATEFRANIYRLLDQVIETGIPLEIERKGHVVRVVPERTATKLSRLEKREGVMNCDPEELIHLDWSSEWKP